MATASSRQPTVCEARHGAAASVDLEQGQWRWVMNSSAAVVEPRGTRCGCALGVSGKHLNVGKIANAGGQIRALGGQGLRDVLDALVERDWEPTGNAVGLELAGPFLTTWIRGTCAYARNSAEAPWTDTSTWAVGP